MTNIEVSLVFDEIADLLEIAGENQFKVQAYRRAARSIKNYPQAVTELHREGNLHSIPGVGKALAKKIEEMIVTGKLKYLEQLRERVPQGLREMLAIPGLGARSVRTIYEHLGITSLDELEEAAREYRVRELPGLGARTELRILSGIELLKSRRGSFPLGAALPIAETVCADLAALPRVEQVEIAGEVRRGWEAVREIIILVCTSFAAEVLGLMEKHPLVQQVVWCTETAIRVSTIYGGLEIEVQTCSRERFAFDLVRLTGSEEHWHGLRERLAARAGNLGEDGSAWTEEEVYRLAGLTYIPPELREGTTEIAVAEEGSLPELVEIADIRGDLHVHTNWSDGIGSIRDMVEAAERLGYEYIAITDHSQSLAVARGLAPEKLRQQVEEINRLNDEREIHIFTGTEVDIKKDGQLDYPDELLRELDIVIASIHTNFHLSEESMTARVEAALKHPLVTMLAHPTGRMLLERKPYALNMDRIWELCARTGTWLELNASPDRLDINAEQVKTAREYGIPIAINTDAHQVSGLADMRYGVLTARRGWAEAKDVVNTWPLGKLKQELNHKKG